MFANRCYNFKRQKFHKERSQEDSKIEKPYNRNAVHEECKTKCDTNNNRGNWNYPKIIQK